MKSCIFSTACSVILSAIFFELDLKYLGVAMIAIVFLSLAVLMQQYLDGGDRIQDVDKRRRGEKV